MTKILILGVHNDDAEYGMGGTAALLARAGAEVSIGWLTSAYHEGLSAEQANDSVRALGIARKMVRRVEAADAILYGEASIEAYKEMIEEADPDVAFIMWPKDNHIEHEHCAKAQLDALYRAGRHVKEIYAYEVGPLQTMTLFGTPELSINITSEIPRLRELLANFNEGGSLALWQEKEVCARFRGHMSYAKVNGCAEEFEYAEAFRIVKLPDGGADLILRRMLESYFRWGGTGVYAIGRQYYM